LAPVTIIYGAKANQLQAGAKKVWSGLPKDAKVENLALQGDLSAATGHLQTLKETLFQLSDMSPTAFGGIEAVSNTSGVALSIQFAPMVDKMKIRRMTYTDGIQRINYLTLKMMAMTGDYSPPDRMPYYSSLKWPDPLPRDKQLMLQNLMQMHALKLISRVQILRELISNDIAPSQLEVGDAEAAIQAAMDEELRFLQAFGPPESDGSKGDQSDDGKAKKGKISRGNDPNRVKKNQVSAAEDFSLKSQVKSEIQTSV
jgi:hypothetical protein